MRERDSEPSPPAARLEDELAALGSLAVETGRARSPEEVAETALGVLCRATAADAGLILSVDRRFEATASVGLSAASIGVIQAYGAIGDRLAKTLERVDTAFSVPLEDAPVGPDIQAALRADGISHVAFVGMRVHGKLAGVLGLGWREPTLTRPSGPVLLQAAALVASALENARLLQRVEQGLEQERSLTARLGTLVELTRLPVDAGDESAMARDLLERIASLLGAVGGSVIRIGNGRLQTLASHGIDPELVQLQGARPATEWGFAKRFAAGTDAYVETIDDATVSGSTLEASRGRGFQAYAAFPIRDGGRLEGVLIAVFAQPASELPIDDRTLEAIGRVLDISFANQRLRAVAVASEERYRTLFERSPYALVVQTLDDVVVDANPAAYELYGEGLIGRHVRDLAVIDDDEIVRTREVVLDAGTSTWVGTGLRLDGSTFPEEVESARIRIGDEDRILARIRDTTERDRLQQELLQAQKMEAIGLLVAGVAHELNNPLASIVAFSQLIRTDPHLPEELHHHADLLIQESNRTRRIVQNLLDFARQRPPERVPTSLHELIDGVLALQSYSFGPSRIEAILDIPDDLPNVPLDRAQIQQVLVNLTLNAAQAIRTRGDRGKIWIAAKRRDGDDTTPTVQLTITDDGPGIPEELRSRLFVPFFTTKAPGEGTGLGLSVSFGILAGHGGTLRYEPGPNGRGTSFILELPVDSAQPPAAETPLAAIASLRAATVAAGPTPGKRRAPTAERSRPARVLVLDDEPSIRDFLARILRRNGIEPIVAADGLSALEVIRNDPPDAILCDHRMAGMTGTNFHNAVVEIAPELATRFAFMSGDVLNPELHEFASERGIGVLAKPFDIESVERTIAALLDDPAGATSSSAT